MSDVLKKLAHGEKYVFHPSGMEQAYQIDGKTVVYLFVGFDLEGRPVFDAGSGPFTKSKDDMHFLANLREYREPREVTVWGVVWICGFAGFLVGFFATMWILGLITR